MASVDECRQALQELAARLDENADHVRERVNLDRTLACRITDLAVAFHGRLADGRLLGLADGDDPKAKIALNIGSDDLLAMVRGELDVGRAMATRRLSINASPFDLLKLRKLL
ncbi:SCP2 sterol-binding domain-containing protein [Solwaraspora sp. WMMD406]|uniref:SCP2 sterol-binding domain-containing protein n=1 Tax=Solwaraspora sp. WMMD406 TaxID=3016095 RepID=UPI0024178C41|nr:SCP2 sterol-binding domain-containing protein [Solwaraspora sp. WMMD406]MDG4766394.1 SCP2 sterol-binding domain-containing protein [Solwaraspora sp. WMMD406]